MQKRQGRSKISPQIISIQEGVDKLGLGDGLLQVQISNPDLIYLDKCAICKKPASKSCGNCELEYYCSKEHQKEDWYRHRSQCCKYDVRKHSDLGFCMVATKAINPGDVIASEYPLTIYNQLISPKKDLQILFSLSNTYPYLCPSCEIGKLFPGTFHRCSKCGMPLCREACEESGLHNLECEALMQMGTRIDDSASIKDILADVVVLRVLLKEHRKGKPISFENRKWKAVLKKVFAEKLNADGLCSKSTVARDIVLSLKAVESLPLSMQFCNNKELVILLHCALTTYGISQTKESRRKFLYTKNQWLTHSCFSNAEMWIDGQENYYKLIIKATRPIKPGQRITINKGESFSYLPTMERREKLLKSFGVNCRCKRCRDPSELGTFVSAIRCEEHLSSNSCCGHYLPKNPLNDRDKWKCTESSCKSSKTYLEIKHMVRNLGNELPSISGGQAEVILKKLNDFILYYNGDLLCPSHYIIRMAKSRMREVVNCFLGSSEKMFLCVVSDFPRAFEYCSINLKSIESMLFFLDKVNPTYSKTRGKLLFEKASVELALSLYEYHVLRQHTTASLIQKVQRILKTLSDSSNAISIYTRPLSLKDNISFFTSIIRKLFRDALQSNGNYSSNGLSVNDALEKVLCRANTRWKEKSKEIGLVTFYMEPLAHDAPSIATLRNIIVSDI